MGIRGKGEGFFLRKGLLKRHEMVGKSIKCSIAAPAKRIDFVSFPKLKVLIRNLQSYHFFGYFFKKSDFYVFPKN